MAKRTINILVLGETGVGKTTFINMLPYYLFNQSLADTASKDLMVLAPISFIHVDEDLNEKSIQLGSDSNEVSIPGASSTQSPRTYIFDLPLKNSVLRVIDTPGIGDTRGPERDQQNTQVLLHYISELQYLDAVCILLKPDNSRFSILFDYCLRIILKQLMATMRNNLLFVFTRTRGTHYSPGETYSPLKKAIEDIQRETNSVIPFEKANTFCVDNEAFRYLAARRNGITFLDDDVERFTESYNRSLTVANRMIDYIVTLRPVPMQNVATPNESKRVILRLSKPLLSLLKNYEKALVNIEEYKQILQANMQNVDMLKQNLFKIEYQRIVKEHNTYERQQSTRGGFNINASFPPFMISGSAYYNLTDDKNEKKTQDIDFVEKKTFDKDVYAMITNETTARAAVQTKITELNNVCDEYKTEMSTILGAVALFYIYSKENNMVTSDDPFKKALQAAKDEALLDNKDILAREFDSMIRRYEIKKNSIADVHPEDIKDVTRELFALKHSGQSFKQIMNTKFTFHTVQLTR